MARLLQYDHYKVLGIDRDASSDIIKQAYREKVKFCHPDRNPSPKAAEAFNAVQEAYDELIDPQAREAYNERMFFYQPMVGTVHPDPAYRPNAVKPDRESERATWSFAALHLVGILFATAMGVNSVVGILFREWPIYTFIFSLPALLVLPDAIGGFRKAVKSWG